MSVSMFFFILTKDLSTDFTNYYTENQLCTTHPTLAEVMTNRKWGDIDDSTSMVDAKCHVVGEMCFSSVIS